MVNVKIPCVGYNNRVNVCKYREFNRDMNWFLGMYSAQYVCTCLPLYSTKAFQVLMHENDSSK